MNSNGGRTMWRSMKCIKFVVVSFLCLGVASAGAEDKPKTESSQDLPKITPLVKGKGYFIHLIQHGGLIGAREFLLVHTSRDSGEMKGLIGSAHARLPMGSGGQYYVSRFAGITSDAERLYVVMWNAPAVSVDPDVFSNDQRLQSPMPVAVVYQLIVFRLEDGKRLMDLSLNEGKLPQFQPNSNFGKGPTESARQRRFLFRHHLRVQGRQAGEPEGGETVIEKVEGSMSKITLYQQERKDGGLRMGLECDGETLLHNFQEGSPDYDPVLLWCINIRCDKKCPNCGQPRKHVNGFRAGLGCCKMPYTRASRSFRVASTWISNQGNGFTPRHQKVGEFAWSCQPCAG